MNKILAHGCFKNYSTLKLIKMDNKPFIWMHAHIEEDKTYGLPNELRDKIEKYFSILTTKELESQPTLASNILGALLIPKRYGHLRNWLDRMPNLRVIANHGVGLDHITSHLKEYESRGVRVSNVPDALTDATADLGMALLLASARNIIPGVEEAMGSTDITEFHGAVYGEEVHGSTIGIVGMGRIGAKIAKRARGFDMRVLYHNRRRRADDVTLHAEYCEHLNDLLKMSDFVVLVCPLTDDTKGLMGSEQFQIMKKTATLVNIARGGVVQQDALYDALKSNSIRAAALDVTSPEPLPRDHLLLTLPRSKLIIVPHYGSATRQTRMRMVDCLVDNLVAGIKGKPMPNEVTNQIN